MNRPAQRPRIQFLEHLCYVFESFAQLIGGEAKHELSRLIDRCRDGDLVGVIDPATIDKLQAARTLAISGPNYDRVSFALAEVSRAIWSVALAPGTQAKRVLYIDMDNVLVDFASGIARLPPDVAARFTDRLDEAPGVFALMDPIPGALDAYRELSELFDTFILSTSPWENPSAWSDKLHWVKTHIGDRAHKRLILTHHKNLNTGDFLIDDRTKNGVDRFGGEHIHFGTSAFPDWSAVLAYLRPKAATTG